MRRSSWGGLGSEQRLGRGGRSEPFTPGPSCVSLCVSGFRACLSVSVSPRLSVQALPVPQGSGSQTQGTAGQRSGNDSCGVGQQIKQDTQLNWRPK